jgi:hypothetical protein
MEGVDKVKVMRGEERIELTHSEGNVSERQW